jgi:hypothetical protein
MEVVAAHPIAQAQNLQSSGSYFEIITGIRVIARKNLKIKVNRPWRAMK